MQQRLQEEREAKRATMDGRHEYILSMVADKLDMKPEVAEDFILEGEQLKELDLFMAPGGHPSLLFYYQPPKPGTGTCMQCMQC